MVIMKSLNDGSDGDDDEFIIMIMIWLFVVIMISYSNYVDDYKALFVPLITLLSRVVQSWLSSTLSHLTQVVSWCETHHHKIRFVESIYDNNNDEYNGDDNDKYNDKYNDDDDNWFDSK